MRKIQPRYRLEILKQIWDETPNKQKLEQNGYSEDGLCHLCKEQDDSGNFMRCTDGGLRTHTRRLIGNLKTRMRELGVNPFMATWINKLLGRSPIIQRVTPLGFEQRVGMAYEAYSTIWWGHLLKGRIPERMVGLHD